MLVGQSVLPFLPSASAIVSCECSAVRTKQANEKTSLEFCTALYHPLDMFDQVYIDPLLTTCSMTKPGLYTHRSPLLAIRMNKFAALSMNPFTQPPSKMPILQKAFDILSIPPLLNTHIISNQFPQLHEKKHTLTIICPVNRLTTTFSLFNPNASRISSRNLSTSPSIFLTRVWCRLPPRLARW